jgi:hypothetical protein
VHVSGREPVPERIRFEIVNHQATAAVLLGDLDAFEVHVAHAAVGVMVLGSRQRQKEMRDAWKRAQARWPKDNRMHRLDEQVRPALTARIPG